MKFLIDNGVSPVVANGLRTDGHDTVHVRDRGLQRATDDQLFDLAAAEDRIIVSVDTDFGTLLAMRETEKPSVILFRSPTDRRPVRQLELLRLHLIELEPYLIAGAMIVFEESRIRVRTLPIGSRIIP